MYLNMKAVISTDPGLERDSYVSGIVRSRVPFGHHCKVTR